MFLYDHAKFCDLGQQLDLVVTYTRRYTSFTEHVRTIQANSTGDLLKRHPPVVADEQILRLLKECLKIWWEGGRDGRTISLSLIIRYGWGRDDRSLILQTNLYISLMNRYGGGGIIEVLFYRQSRMLC